MHVAKFNKCGEKPVGAGCLRSAWGPCKLAKQKWSILSDMGPRMQSEHGIFVVISCS